MRSLGLSPDVKTYTSLIAASAQEAGAARPVALFEEMLAAGIQPNVVRPSGVSAHPGIPVKGDRRIELVPAYPIAQVCYTALLTALQRAGQPDRSLDYFRQMESEGIQPDVVSYNSVIAAFARRAFDPRHYPRPLLFPNPLVFFAPLQNGGLGQGDGAAGGDGGQRGPSHHGHVQCAPERL